jgi:hypothetical protein
LGGPAPKFDSRAIQEHFATWIGSAATGNSHLELDDFAHLRWIPPRELFPRDSMGRAVALGRQEVVKIVRGVIERLQGNPQLALTEREKSYIEYELHILDEWGQGRGAAPGCYDLNWIMDQAPTVSGILDRQAADARLVLVARDGLVLAIPEHFKDGGRRASCMYWPGQWIYADGATRTTQEFLTLHGHVLDVSGDLLDDLLDQWQFVPGERERMRSIEEDFSRLFPARLGPDFASLVELMRGQLESEGIRDGEPIVLYDTYGSGKSTLVCAAVLRTLYPNSSVQVLLGHSKDLRMPSVAPGIPVSEPVWPFSFGGIKNGRLVLKGVPSGNLVPMLFLILAAHNAAALYPKDPTHMKAAYAQLDNAALANYLFAAELDAEHSS